MYKTNIGKVWTYFKTKYPSGFIFAYFNEPKYENSLYIYTSRTLKDIDIPYKLKESLKIITPEQEINMLQSFSKREKKKYEDILLENNIFGYNLYQMPITKSNIDTFLQSLKGEI